MRTKSEAQLQELFGFTWLKSVDPYGKLSDTSRMAVLDNALAYAAAHGPTKALFMFSRALKIAGRRAESKTRLRAIGDKI